MITKKISDFRWLAIVIAASLLFLGFMAYLDRSGDGNPQPLQAQSVESSPVQSSEVQINDGSPPLPGSVIWESHCDDGWVVRKWPVPDVGGYRVICYRDSSPSINLFPFTVSVDETGARISRGDLVITIRAGE